MSQNISLLEEKIKRLEEIQKHLASHSALDEKINYLKELPLVKKVMREANDFRTQLEEMNPTERYLLTILLAIEQAPIVLVSYHSDALHDLIQSLESVEDFYKDLGGIVGYQLSVLKLIVEDEKKIPCSKDQVTYEKPPGIDISKDTPEIRMLIRKGLEDLEQMAEVYPVGGAGDRLKLWDKESNEPLPAAQLPFLGRSLLAGMIRDLQAKEYLHFKLFGKQVSTPIVMMTSHEKHNHEHIFKICQQHNWFGKLGDDFFIFTQPLVPVVTFEGEWVLNAPGKLMLKPGGHGVIWKLAREKKVFDWLKRKGRKSALVRQINNPVAGIDYGLLAFTGLGLEKKKIFGFSSCERYLNVSEGMDILIEKKTEEGFQYALTNVEYTEFAKRGVRDMPEKEGSPFSIFPANTNILFVDLKAIHDLVPEHPLPGTLINMKTTIPHVNAKGCLTAVRAGRLETTMQNIADAIVDTFTEPIGIEGFEKLRSYITYNKREKTISVTKKSYVTGGPVAETPEGCFFEILQNYHELLQDYCGFEMPPLGDQKKYLSQGPSFVFGFHPALGPLYAVIAQKVRKGKIKEGSELQLEIAEADIEGLELDGSLLIEAEAVLGDLEESGKVIFGAGQGRCRLKNVVVQNKGIDRSAPNEYWKNKIERLESVSIKLLGNSEFVAENVTFKGPLDIVVLPGHRMTVIENEGSLTYKLDKISKPSWDWHYSFDAENRIVLNK